MFCIILNFILDFDLYDITQFAVCTCAHVLVVIGTVVVTVIFLKFATAVLCCVQLV